ncbi:MAG: serine hydrolase [Roseburia sp.]|nr:serine hydrolase [Roseburia sp.]
MKCINSKLTCLLFLFLFLSGCGEKNEEVTFSDAYQIYQTSQKYQMISVEDTSLQDTYPYFAEKYCISDGIALGTDKTDSQVAEAAGVFNLDTKEVTYCQNIYERVYPASTTKILTAYVALKYGDLDDVYQVSARAVDQESDSSVCNLKEGDYLSLRQLIYGLMMRSGNDAAIVIAEGISGSVEEFAALMNEEARALGALDSHFVNSNGLHDEEHYTTVYDMYLFFQAAIAMPDFLDFITKTEYTAQYLDSAGMTVEQVWTSTNKYLMGTEDAPRGITVVGGKTGTTHAAGYCLVLYSTNNQNQQIVSIVMKADCRNNLYYYMNELLYGFAGNS